MPEVSIIMAAYNSQDTICETIESILGQTFKDFDLIIIDDGSTDATAHIIKSYKDKRIRYIQNQRNYGLPTSLNNGFLFAKGKYVARMDADDIMLPDRLELQIRFLSDHPDISVVGSDYMIFKGDKNIKRMYMPLTDDEIRGEALNHSPFCHPTIMVRREVFETFKYNPGFRYCQDYELWSRVLTKYKTANIPKVLLRYRLSEKSNTADSNKKLSERKCFLDSIYRNFLISQLGLNVEDYNEELQFILGSSSNISTIDIVRFPPMKIKAYFDKQIKSNKKSKFCSAWGIKAIAGKVWLKYLMFNYNRLLFKDKFRMVFCLYFIWGVKFVIQQHRIHRN